MKLVNYYYSEFQNLLKNRFFFILLFGNTSSEEDLILKIFKHGLVYYNIVTMCRKVTYHLYLCLQAKQIEFMALQKILTMHV